jgi:shikimate kinase
MFATAGEEIFREVEHHTLLDALEEPKPHVVSTGGGVVIRDDNRELIIEGGWCVWLRGQPETLVDRIGNDIDRPMLGDDAYASLKRLADERGPWYDELADEIIDVDLVTPEDVVTQVLFAARGAGVIK